MTAASELARNTLVHGGGGAVLLEALHDGARRGLRLTFDDKGPGIADVARALKDGYTTGSGLGLGLGGAKRLSNEFEISSAPGQGTRVRIARWSVTGMQRPAPLPDRRPQSGRRGAPRASRSWPRGSGSTRCRGRSWRSSSTSSAPTSSSTRAAASCSCAALPGRPALEILALDTGRGMASVEECFRDGHSTSGSAGTGLGAVRRLASFVDVYSRRPGGTAIVAHVAAPEALGPGRPALARSARCACPRPGEDGLRRWLGDGGYGGRLSPDGGGRPRAWARRGRRGPRRRAVLRAGPDRSARPRRCRRSIRPSAAPAARRSRWLSIDRRAGVAIFAGVGNIAGSIIADRGSRQLVSLNGTAGHTVHKITRVQLPLDR